LNEIIIQCSL